jgi:hypothetical protein
MTTSERRLVREKRSDYFCLWLSADSAYIAVRLGFRRHHFVFSHRGNHASQPALNCFLRQRSARGSARPQAVQPGNAQTTATAQHDSLGRMVNLNDSDGKGNKASSS